MSAELAIKKEIGAHEHLLWSGMPRQGLVLRPSDILLVPFSLMWGGFAIFWEFSVVQHGAPLFFMIWGVPFVIMGLYMIVGRFFADSIRRRRTYYGLTDQRILILTTLIGHEVKSISLHTLSNITLTERRDGSGSIMFGPTPDHSTRWSRTGKAPGPAFEFIDNVRKVYDLIKAAQNPASRQ